MQSLLDTGLASGDALPVAYLSTVHAAMCVAGGIACLTIGVVAVLLCASTVRGPRRGASEPSTTQRQRSLELEVESRRAAEVSMRRNEARYRSLIDASCSLVWVTDRAGEFIVDGGSFELLAGLAEGPDTPIDWKQLLHGDDAESFEARWKAGIGSGRAFESAARFASTDQDGSRMCLVRAAPVLAEEGHVIEWVASLRDIEDAYQRDREHKDIERRARESQHLESLGVLAGGVAHDFNNLLVGVMGHAELITRRIDRSSPIQENARSIVDSAERAAALCKKMLAFAGKGRFLPERCQLSNVVRNAQRTLSDGAPTSVKFSFEYDEREPATDINPEEVRQLLQIFVNNSVEAVDGRPSGTVHVKTGSRFFAAEEFAQTKLGATCVEGLYAFIEVTDNGPGIPADVMPRIFEPFFSTKFVGRGLSLAAALGIARTHGGTVQIVSRPGATCARVLLPALAAQVHDSGVRLSAVGRKVQGTVLVVDDDTSVRDLARLTIEDIGAKVLTASSGVEAVQLFRGKHAQIDLVLLDLTMPKMDGATALRHLREIDPGVRVILTSGYLATDAIERIGNANLEGFVQKPWRPSTLAERMMNALTRGTQRARPTKNLG